MTTFGYLLVIDMLYVYVYVYFVSQNNMSILHDSEAEEVIKFIKLALKQSNDSSALFTALYYVVKAQQKELNELRVTVEHLKKWELKKELAHMEPRLVQPDPMKGETTTSADLIAAYAFQK
jgi:hypothetical protein